MVPTPPDGDRPLEITLQVHAVLQPFPCSELRPGPCPPLSTSEDRGSTDARRRGRSRGLSLFPSLRLGDLHLECWCILFKSLMDSSKPSKAPVRLILALLGPNENQKVLEGLGWALSFKKC